MAGIGAVVARGAAPGKPAYMGQVSETPIFEAVIIPHRSMGRAGLRWVLGLLLGLSGLISAGLWWAGAWPVVGFCGAEIVLAIVLLRRNAGQVGPSEMLLLTETGLSVLRTDTRGRRTERLMAAGFLAARLEARPGRSPALVVSDRRARVEVGASLGEEEKRNLAVALEDALYRQRNPVFDNPQLRTATLPSDPST